MTTNITTDEQTSGSRPGGILYFVEKIPGAQTLKNTNIGFRLLLGFGIMIFITLLAVAFSYLGTTGATDNIDRTTTVRAPTALASAKAQASLLKMLGDVRGYLALGQPEYQASYARSRTEFVANLAELESNSPNLSAENQQLLKELEATFTEWSALPEKLFELRDDQLEREPAYKILATDGILLGGTVLIEVGKMIESQGRREATTQNLDLIKDMAQFQGTFASMLSGLRGYVTTRNRTFKGEYEANLLLNEFAWEQLQSKEQFLTPDQQESLKTIADDRSKFLKLPDQMFTVLESDQWRKDLYLFSTEALPLTDKMQELLARITNDQQSLLQTELETGRAGLLQANSQIVIIGLVALILGMALAVIFRENIAGPIRRLTGVAERIREGNLAARANVESTDEIGILAGTFNQMTDQLNNTLVQVQWEKKRADDLLDVVIPIGIELSAEKDFNRLLENMLLEAKNFCNANGGILYLRREKEHNLRLVIVRNDRENIILGGTSKDAINIDPLPLLDPEGNPNYRNVVTHAALHGESINIADTRQTTVYDFSASGKMSGYQSAQSMLVIPLKNTKDEVLGVMQLLDPYHPDTQKIIPFDGNLQQMMESFSSLAAAALEAYIREQSLKQEIQQLRIEIDEAKRQQQVSEIVDTDFFSDLQARAKDIRKRGERIHREGRSRKTGADTDTNTEVEAANSPDSVNTTTSTNES
jgi:CHASE3 domain sensor protein